MGTEPQMTPHSEGSPGARPPTRLIGCLLTLAVAMVACALAGAAAVLLSRWGRGELGDGLLAAGLALGGLVAGCLLWAAAYLVRRAARAAILQERLLIALGRLLDGAGDGAAGGGAASAGRTGPAPDETMREVLRQLREINDSLLLPPEQREDRRRHRHHRLLRQLRGDVEAALSAEDLARAERSVAEFDDRFGDEPAAEELRRRIAQVRDDSRRRELAEAAGKAEDLMALGRFVDAESLAADLAGRYPQAAVATELLARVRREGQAYETERRARLLREVERAAEQRQWRTALRAAGAYLAAFPEGPDSDHIRAWTPTIQDNARLEEAREIRDAIRDLISRRRYGEALELARDLMARFPDTRAAVELNQQLGRLEDLARGKAE